VVDAEACRLLRLTCFAGDQPASRHDLSGAAEAEVPEAGADGADAEDFAFEVPDGLRVVRAGADDDRPASSLQAAADTRLSSQARRRGFLSPSGNWRTTTDSWRR
jgi:hypothetical protein